jgi:hypothetical protein
LSVPRDLVLIPVRLQSHIGVRAERTVTICYMRSVAHGSWQIDQSRVLHIKALTSSFLHTFNMAITRNLLLALVAFPFLSVRALSIRRRDVTPNLPYDPNTSKDCTWWVDYDGSQACEAMLENELTNLADFRRWVRVHCQGSTLISIY